jgi:hypothetical protein
LDEASTPLMPDKDGPAITDAIALAVDEDTGTCKSPSKKFILVITNANLHPLQVRVYQREVRLQR